MECQHNKQRTMQGEIICIDCGLVLDHELVHDEPITESYADLNIAGGKPVPPKRIGAGHIYSHQERLYLQGKQDIQLLREYVTLPRIVEKDALRLWHFCVKQKLSWGRHYDATISAVVYLAALLHKQNISPEKLAVFSSPLLIQRRAEALLEIFNLKIVLPNSISELLLDTAAKLGFSQCLQKEAIILYDNTSFKHKSEKTIVLGVLYYLTLKYQMNVSLLNICRLEEISLSSVKKITQTLEAIHGKD